MPLGILVHADNHFIVRGPLPDRSCARALARRWEFVPVAGLTKPQDESRFANWRISTREFREDLEWAVVLEGDRPVQSAVGQLLSELESRGVVIHHAPGPFLPDEGGEQWSGLGCGTK